MDSSVSPTIIDLSSDSEHGNDENPQVTSLYSNQAVDEASFTLDWADYDYPTSADDILDHHNKVGSGDPDKASISSAETEIYPFEINEDITVVRSSSKENESQVLPKTVNALQKQVEKLQKEHNKFEKKRKREEKKAQELKQKRLRTAAAQKQKILKPEENIKLLTINIDTKLVNTKFGATLIASLQQADIDYQVGNQIKPYTIFWSKKVKDIIVTDEGVTQEDVGSKEEKELFYVLHSNEMVKLVNTNELLTHIQTIKSVYYDKCLTLVITGLEKYLHTLQKKLSQSRSIQHGKNRREISSGDSFLYVTKEEIESALIELQIIGNCNHRVIESGEELTSLVLSTTKSLSQLDYKRQKYEREGGDLDWFAKGDSKHCVKVDKNGTGLEKLWLQQICQFNAVGLEIASAIISSYHSPQNLVNSYKKCRSKSEGELLLQDIRIRKEAGILSSTRRIGPEISRKLYNFYMSDDPDLEL